MPLNDSEDDDTFHETPPRLSVALDDEDNYTVQSIEAGRRALLGRSRLSRESFGSLRLSERFADVGELGVEAVGEAEEGGEDEDYDENAVAESGMFAE